MAVLDLLWRPSEACVILRDYQETSIHKVHGSFRRGNRGVFLVLPTGGGKTLIFTEIIRHFNGHWKKCVVVTHRQELIKQACKTIEKNGMIHGVIKAGPSTCPAAPIQVVSIDSMRTRDLPWEPDLIVLDEAHLAKSDRYKQFLSRYPDAYLLLVSATPIRTDGSGFNDLAQDLIIGATINDLIHHPEGPFLVPPRIYTASELVGLEKVKTTAGDYNQGELQEYMGRNTLVGDIVEQYQAKAYGRKGVVFCVGIDHSKKVAAQFNAAGIPAEHLDGTMNDSQRSGILRRLHTGETMIVCNAGVLCEGWDEPSISYVGLARPTKSLPLYIQQAGRGIRIYPGKTDCVINDHGGNVERHGHILEERLWTLYGKTRSQKEEKKNYKECPLCSAWISLKDRICPYCQYAYPERTIEVLKGDLKPPEKKPVNPVHQLYKKLLRYGKSKGKKPAWAYFEMLNRVGERTLHAELTLGQAERMQKEVYN